MKELVKNLVNFSQKSAADKIGHGNFALLQSQLMIDQYFKPHHQQTRARTDLLSFAMIMLKCNNSKGLIKPSQY